MGKPKQLADSWVRDDDLRQWIETVKMLVRYSDVIEEFELPVDRFQRFRDLAVFEVFFNMTRKEQVVGLGGGCTTQTILNWLKDERYQFVEGLVRERAKSLAKSKGMMDAAEQLEPQLAETVLHLALSGTGRDKLKALDEFTGRLSAKKGREDQIVVRFPPEFEEAIRNTMELQESAKRKLLSSGGETDAIDVESHEISASVIPLPEDGRS